MWCLIIVLVCLRLERWMFEWICNIACTVSYYDTPSYNEFIFCSKVYSFCNVLSLFERHHIIIWVVHSRHHTIYLYRTLHNMRVSQHIAHITCVCLVELFLSLLLIKCDLCLQGRCKAWATAGSYRYDQWKSSSFSFNCREALSSLFCVNFILSSSLCDSVVHDGEYNVCLVHSTSDWLDGLLKLWSREWMLWLHVLYHRNH